MSDGAVLAESGGETVDFAEDGEPLDTQGATQGATTQGGTRAKPITPAQKKELFAFFEANFDGWRSTSLPRSGVDPKLDELLEKLGLSRSQASRQLCTFKKSSRPSLVAVRVDASAEDIKKNLLKRLGGVETVVDFALESFTRHRFCVEDVEIRGKYYQQYRGDVRPHIVGLVEAFVEAAAHSSARSVSAADQMVTKFATSR